MSLTATLVDVRPQPGRRVRDQEGSLLPDTHILRGVPRSAYWLRLARDGDVEMTEHKPDGEPSASVDEPPAPVDEPPAPVELPPLPIADGKKKG